MGNTQRIKILVFYGFLAKEFISVVYLALALPSNYGHFHGFNSVISYTFSYLIDIMIQADLMLL